MAGRESSYVTRYAEQAYRLCLLGYIDVELADFFGVSEVTLNAWKKQFPEFLKSLEDGKSVADAEVAEKLFHRAKGYSHEAVKIFMPPGSSEPVYATYTEHYPPDTTAASLWLRNRQPTKWRDRTETHNTTTINADTATGVQKVAHAMLLMIESAAVPTIEDEGSDR